MNLSILLLEDDEVLSNSLRKALELRGYEVTTAGNGKEGLHCLQNNRFDIILLDLLMPEMSGINFLRERRKNKSWTGIPVIILTNYPEQEYIDEIVQHENIAGFLTKANVTLKQIVDRVASVVD